MHCAVTPFVVGVLPLFGLSLFSNQRTEWIFVAISAVLGISSLLPSYVRRHQRAKPLVLFLLGLSLILFARLSLDETLRAEIPFVVFGAMLVAGSHLVNRRLCRSCTACAEDCE
jgi:uncharacterized membrane protein YfhO